MPNVEIYCDPNGRHYISHAAIIAQSALSELGLLNDAVITTITSNPRFCKNGRQAPFVRVLSSTPGDESARKIALMIHQLDPALDIEFITLDGFIEGRKQT